MVLAHVRATLSTVGKKGPIGALKQAWNDGWIMALLDGNLFETKRRALGATLVGVDSHGNKYYERIHGVQNGRHRWVEYPESWGYNASTVPPEWHGWLHHITDNKAPEMEKFKPNYAIPHRANLTGVLELADTVHRAQGHALNPDQRDWGKVAVWEPQAQK